VLELETGGDHDHQDATDDRAKRRKLHEVRVPSGAPVAPGSMSACAPCGPSDPDGPALSIASTDSVLSIGLVGSVLSIGSVAVGITIVAGLTWVFARKRAAGGGPSRS
jgi:hypothetical protein